MHEKAENLFTDVIFVTIHPQISQNSAIIAQALDLNPSK